jgi:hypothetical protein
LKIVVLMIFAFSGLTGFEKSASAFTDKSVIYGFNQTVFGSEFTSGSQSNYIRKFRSPVKFYIHNRARKNRRGAARRFILSLNRLVRGLKTRVVNDPDKANFHLYIVDRKDYNDTVRNTVYRRSTVTVRGWCMVRAIFTRFGISRADAVIVSDEGGARFRRCLVEEVLQGLGPLNENISLSASMFNDRTHHTRFTRFDRYIMNMLYDRRLRSGDSQKSVQSLLPRILDDVRRRIR